MTDPVTLEAEREVIGSCFAFEKCYFGAVEKLKKEHFPCYAPVWEKVLEFDGKGRDHEDLKYDLVKMMPEADLEYHHFYSYRKPSINEQIEFLIDQRKRVRTKEISEMLYRAMKEEPDLEPELMKASQEIADLLTVNSGSEKTMPEVMKESIALSERLQSGEVIGFETGLDIDDYLMGMKKKQFYILAGRPSMGKTALALQLSHKIAEQASVGILSLETSHSSLGFRHISNRAGISLSRILSGSMDDEEVRKFKYVTDQLANLRVVTNDTTDVSAENIRSMVHSMKRKYGIEFLIIDYVQLMKSGKDIREQQVADVSRTCRRMAVEFDICVLGLAQLSRKSETRGDKRPMLSDLRESGQLEQDAYCVMLIHRPEAYGIKEDAEGNSTAGIAEVIIAKHKDGPTGKKRLFFKNDNVRFENLEWKRTGFE